MTDGRRHILSSHCIGIMALVMICAEPVTFAQSTSPKASGKTPQTTVDGSLDRKSPRPDLSDSDLQSTMAFASEHHPELARLLEHLKKSRPSEFQKAMRELNQQVQGLEKIRERNPSRYSHNLTLWRTDSQIRVLVAKWSQTNDKKLESEIRELLKERREAKLAQLELDRQRLSEQLRKIETQMGTLSSSSDEQLDHEWEQLAKKTNASRKVGTKSLQKNATKSGTGSKSGS